MTAGELIDKLARCPQDRVVIPLHDPADTVLDITDVVHESAAGVHYLVID